MSELPIYRARSTLEQAIHKALDKAGWPRADNVEPDITYWYVVVMDRYGRLMGHVGPLIEEDAARRCARSWEQARFTTRVARSPQGIPLTNAYE